MLRFFVEFQVVNLCHFDIDSEAGSFDLLGSEGPFVAVEESRLLFTLGVARQLRDFGH